MKAVARIESGILFEWVTHRKPTLSDLYLIHQQGWEGAAEHISQPDRIAWKSMCATGEGKEKGEKWSKRAIWRNTLPAVKDAWKSVDKLTSGRSSECGAATGAAERMNQKISLTVGRSFRTRGPSGDSPPLRTRGAAHRSVVPRMHFTSSTTRSVLAAR